jgi:hypothetical protein
MASDIVDNRVRQQRCYCFVHRAPFFNGGLGSYNRAFGILLSIGNQSTEFFCCNRSILEYPKVINQKSLHSPVFLSHQLNVCSQDGFEHLINKGFCSDKQGFIRIVWITHFLGQRS